MTLGTVREIHECILICSIVMINRSPQLTVKKSRLKNGKWYIGGFLHTCKKDIVFNSTLVSMSTNKVNHEFTMWTEYSEYSRQQRGVTGGPIGRHGKNDSGLEDCTAFSAYGAGPINGLSAH